MQKKLRQKWVIFLIVTVLVLLTILTPPSRSLITDGSTYNRNPNGYGAWYAYMQSQGMEIKRWQDPITKKYWPKTTAITLIRIKPDLAPLNADEEAWLDQGNHLVILGTEAEVTAAPFTTTLPTPVGDVKIQTRRRLKLGEYKPLNERLAFVSGNRLELEDTFGKILANKGKLIVATTPYLAANAYQNESGNFKFLAELIAGLETPIYVDEYIHGYRNKNTDDNAPNQTWYSYLSKTPLFVAMVQTLVVLLVFLWGENYRFGVIVNPKPEAINNSKAYIEALATVLQKAESYEFVYTTIAKDYERQLLKKLGLSMGDRPNLMAIWQQQTGRPTTDLEPLLHSPQPITAQKLLNWLQTWQKLLASL